MKNTSLSVSIVLPNWNGRALLAKNLPMVIAAARGAEVIVADDNSADESVAFLKEKFPQVIIVANTRQQGFAGNVNSGVAKAHGDIVVLLNTDVRPEAGFLEPLLRRFTDPNVAAVGCLEQSYEPQGVTLRGRGLARWEKGYFIHSRGEVDSEDTAWVAGGSAAYRRSVWQQLGGMDTLYNPFYWEDIDLSYQMIKAGYQILFEKKSIVGHFHEEGKIKTSYSDADIKRIVYRNQFMFLWKNISDSRIWFEHIMWVPIRLMQAVVRGDWLMLQGFVMALLRLPTVIRSRMRVSRYWNKRDSSIMMGKSL